MYDKEYTYDLWPRIWAYVIDLVICGIFSVILFILVIAQLLENESAYPTFGENTIVYIEYGTQFVYFGLFAILTKGRTVGKIMCGCEVLGSDLKPIPRGTIFLREIVKSLTFGINIISFLLCASRKDRKSLHDLITDTIAVKVVYKRRRVEPIVPNLYRNPVVTETMEVEVTEESELPVEPQSNEEKKEEYIDYFDNVVKK